MNPTLNGYKMFLNCKKLPNFVSGEVSIDHANNVKADGYFGAMLPERLKSVWFKTASG